MGEVVEKEISSNVSIETISDLECPSSWIIGVEQMLFNDLEGAPGIQNHDDFLPDDFFADLDLPILDQQVIVPPLSESHSQIANGSGSEEFTAPVSNEEDSNQNHDDDELLDFLLDFSVDKFDDIRVLIDDEYSTPESQIASSEDPGDKDNNSLESGSDDKTGDEQEKAASEDKDDDDDPITKKRKRQMRNRDAAVRSRERKKMYVKDLEVKSKYLERECIRLQRLLQCCAAENHALHLQLQAKAFTASRTKQESAVLLLESLLLGSLLWFLGILGLSLPLEPQVPAGVLVNLRNNNQEIVDLGEGRAKSKSIGLGSFFMNRRCKASRSKMKTAACFGAVVA